MTLRKKSRKKFEPRKKSVVNFRQVRFSFFRRTKLCCSRVWVSSGGLSDLNQKQGIPTMAAKKKAAKKTAKKKAKKKSKKK